MRRCKQAERISRFVWPVAMAVVFAVVMHSQSLGQLARQARARVARAGAHRKVYTNDDIGHAEPLTSPSTPAPASEKATEPGKKEEKGAAAGKKSAQTGKSAEEKRADLEKEYRDRFAKLRDHLATEKEKLDVQQRELHLMQVQYYSNPDVALRQQTFRGQINHQTGEIKKQQAAVEKAKQAISDLEEELRKKGLPPGWAR